MLKIVTTVLVLSISLLQGCASKQHATTADAVQFALQTDTTLRTWVDECQQVSHRAKQVAWQAKNSWWRRNGAYVLGADYGLTNELMKVTDERDVTGALVASGLVAQVYANSQGEVLELLNSTGNKQDLCENVLNKYAEGDYDFNNNPVFYPMLLNLENRATKDKDKLFEKKAAQSTKKSRRFGRSLYVVEKLSNKICSNADVSILKEQWPYEVYNVQCSNTKYSLVRCEWGSCLISE